MKNIFTKSIACLAMLFAASLVWAQDVIVTTDGQRIDAKIIEVSRQQVKYKESDNLDGPTFVLEVEEIGTITYASGKVVTYNQVVAVTSTPAASPTPAATPAPVDTITPAQPAQVVDESTAEILLVSGQTITAQIVALQRDQIKYSLDGVEYILSADQVDKVTFVQNGQVRDYSATRGVVTPIEEELEEQTTIVDTIYSFADFQGNVLPKFVYQKVHVPGKKYKKWRYVGGNMVLTETEFYNIVEAYCPEAANYLKKAHIYLIVECVSILFIPIGLIPVVIFGCLGINNSSKILPTYNASCAGQEISQIDFNPQDYFYDKVQLAIIPTE